MSQPPRLVCSPLSGPSRFERAAAGATGRRRLLQTVDRPRNLGVIEGERLSRAQGYHEQYALAKALASLVAVASILFCAAVILGAIR